MSVRERIKKIDIFGILPDEIKESTLLGLTFSLLFLGIAGVLFFHSVSFYLTNEVSSELIVDHMKDDKEITVNLDISLLKYPCGILSLDKQDQVRTHTVNVREGLKKFRLNASGVNLGVYEPPVGGDFGVRVKAILDQARENEGCQLVGTFNIKLVPGNFHISFHDYGAEMNHLMANGMQFDFSHRVNHLSFGPNDDRLSKKLKSDFNLDSVYSLNGQEALGLSSLGFRAGVTHHLNIVPSKFTYEDTGETHELYQYTSTMMKNPSSMQVMFEMNIENVLMNFKMHKKSFTHFLIMSMAIIGGLYMLINFLKIFLEDAVFKIIFKKRIGKID